MNSRDTKAHDAAGDALLGFLRECRRLLDLAEERRREELQNTPAQDPASSVQAKPAQELTDAQLSIKAEARRIGIDTAVKGWLPAIIRYLAEWGYEALAPLTAVSPASLTAAQLAAVEEAMSAYNRAPGAPPLPNQNPFADETLSDAPMPDGRKLAETGASK